LKTGSGYHQAETAGDPQNMNKFAAVSLGAATTQRIKWILSGRSAVEQMLQWQQALQAEQVMVTRPKRISPLSAFHITETKEGMMMVITTVTRVTQMHDIVKTLQDGPDNAKEILWSEGPWVGEELEKAWEEYYEVHGKTTMKYRVTHSLQHAVTISVKATFVC
jgi:phage-related protein